MISSVECILSVSVDRVLSRPGAAFSSLFLFENLNKNQANVVSVALSPRIESIVEDSRPVQAQQIDPFVPSAGEGSEYICFGGCGLDN